MTHYPKNPFCEWCQRGRMCSARVRRKAADPDVVPEGFQPTAHGQHMSTDTFIVLKSWSDEARTGGGGEYACQTAQDSWSGGVRAYPLTSKDHEHLMVALQNFYPDQPAGGAVVKGDNASEAIKALRKLGWRHEPTLENRWPHNAAHQRDTRTLGRAVAHELSVEWPARLPQDLAGRR